MMSCSVLAFLCVCPTVQTPLFIHETPMSRATDRDPYHTISASASPERQATGKTK